MKKVIWLFLLASVWASATDRTVACGSASGFTSALASAVPGDRILLTNSSGGSQCVYTLGDTTFPKKSLTHPTSEAALTLTISGGAVNGCSVASGGAAYTIAPSVSVVGGGGKNATVHTTISAGAVNSCVVDAGGTNYTKAPTGIVYSSENFIQIIPTNVASLPALGRRLDPTAIVLPKLVFTGTSPIIMAQGSGLYDGASYYYLRGIEITQSNAAEVSLTINANTASHIVLEQMYMYPQPCPNTTAPYNSNGRITVAANGWDIQLRDSYLPCWFGLPPGGTVGQTGTDQMNVVADAYGTGIIIDNNLLTGWFNPFFFGGGDPPASAAGSSTISSRAAGSATLAAPPAAVSLIGLEVPFEGNTKAITSITRASNVVTVVTSSAHGFLTGAFVYPKGVTDTSFNVTYDSNGGANCTVRNDTGCRVITVDNSTTFHYSQTGANATSSGGVIVPTTCGRGSGSSCWIDANVSSIAGNTVNFSHAWVAPFAWGTFDVLAGVPGLLVKSGGAAQWDGTQVVDSEVTRNYIRHDTAFDTWVATNNGNVSKGCPGEVKFWYGGRMEGNWCGGFPVSSVGFNANTAYGSAPWVRISDVRVEGNVFDRFIGIGFGGFEYDPIGPGDHIVVKNNLWAHGDNGNVSNARANMYGPNNIANYLNFDFSHNTILTGLAYTAYPCVVTGANGDCYTTKFASDSAKVDSPFQLPNVPAVTFKDNIIGVGNYGFQCGADGNVAIVGSTGCFGSLTENHNILVSNATGQCTVGSTCGWGTNQFPWANSTGATGAQPLWHGVNGSFPSAMFVKWADVGLTDPNNGNFALSSTSPGHNAASDGTDVGANLATIASLLGPDNPAITAGVANLTLSPSSATVAVTGTQQMTASAPAYFFTNTGTINTSGLYTAPATTTVSTITASQQTMLANDLNTQSNWQTCGNCGDSGGPNPQPNGTFTLVAGNPATFSAQGNYPFNNGFWWYVMGPAGAYNATVDFQESFEMQFPTQADKNASQAVEFELQKNVGDNQYSMAWQICFACGNKLRVFNKTAHAWEESGLTFDPAIFAGGKWVSIQTVYHLTTGVNTRHVSISLNGVNHVVNIDHAPTPAVESDYLHPAFQLDSNGGSPPTPYSVKVRNFDVGVPTGQTATSTITVVTNPLVLSPSSWTQTSATAGQSVSQTFTLTNAGPVDDTVSFQMTQAPSNGSFTVTQNSCGTLVPAGTQCTFVISAGGAVGQYSANLAITDSGGGNNQIPLTLTVSSGVVPPTITPTSAIVSIGKTQQFFTNFTSNQQWTATIGTVGPGGLFTAPLTAGAGTVKVTNTQIGQSASATVTVVSTLTVAPASYNFGAALVNSLLTAQFSVRNLNSIPLSLAALSTSGAPFTVNSQLSTCQVNMILQSQTGCTWTINFLPTAATTYSGTATLRDSAGGQVVLPLSGLGQVPSAVSVSPTSYAWGNVKTSTTSNATFTVSNPGTVPTQVTSLAVTGTGFSAGTGTCFNGIILSPQASCTFVVTFAPVSAIAYTGNLAIVDNSPHTTNATLTGTGTTPPVTTTFTFRNIKLKGLTLR